MKKNDMIKLGVGSVLSSINFEQQELYLVIKNSENGKLACLKEEKDLDKLQDDSSFSVEINGKKVVFNTNTICHLSGKKIASFVATISEEDNKKLHDLLPILFLEKKSEPLLDQEENISVGNLFMVKNQTYLLLDFTSSFYLCSFYHMDTGNFSLPFQMSKMPFIKKVGELSSKQLKDTLKKIKEKQENIGDAIEIGSLLERKNRFYYVYGEENSFWLAAGINFSPIKQVTIDGETYSSSFKQIVQVSKSSKSFRKISQADREEIRKNRSVFYEQNKIAFLMEDIQKNSFTLKTGSLVREKNSLKEYIALLKSNDRIVCLDLQKYLKGEFYLQPFLPEKLEVIGSLKKEVCKEILESLQNKYSSYFGQGEINLLLLEINKN